MKDYSSLRMLLLAIIISLLSIALQTSAFHDFLPRMFVPNLFLLLVLRLSLSSPSFLGVGLVFLTGLFADLADGILLGPWACAYLIVYAAFYVLSDQLFVDSALSRFVAAFFAALLSGTVFFLLALQFAPSMQMSIVIVLSQAFSTAIAATIFLPLLEGYVSTGKKVSIQVY